MRVDPLTSANRCFVVTTEEAVGYSSVPPFHPHETYPECPFDERAHVRNPAYAMVRGLLSRMGLDARNYGSAAWNPLGGLIRSGQTVVLKPNLVSHINYAYRIGIPDTDPLVTHGSVIRAVADYVAIALEGHGRIIVGDCPIQATEWQAVAHLVGLDAIANLYRDTGISFETRDFRLVRAEMRRGRIRAQIAQNLIEDYEEIDLAANSLLMPIIGDWRRFAVSNYDFGRMRRVHNEQRNAYLVPRVVLDADCFINLPKLKFHVKAGITCALKNMVGIIGHKDYLPHFRMGAPGPHSDEYPLKNPFERVYWGLHHLLWQRHGGVSRAILAQLVRGFGVAIPRNLKWQGAGGWYGNDTLWRTVLDINRAFLYYDPTTRSFSERPCRNYLALVDGLIGGEREGPLAPHPRQANCMMGGLNPAAVDAVAATYMGLDHALIPTTLHAFDRMAYPLTDFGPDDIEVLVNDRTFAFRDFVQRGPCVPFTPSDGWRGHVERTLTRDA